MPGKETKTINPIELFKNIINKRLQKDKYQMPSKYDFSDPTSPSNLFIEEYYKNNTARDFGINPIGRDSSYLIVNPKNGTHTYIKSGWTIDPNKRIYGIKRPNSSEYDYDDQSTLRKIFENAKQGKYNSYKHGGKTKKCEEGAEMISEAKKGKKVPCAKCAAAKKGGPVAEFKCGRKMKVKKAEFGADVAEIAYNKLPKKIKNKKEVQDAYEKYMLKKYNITPKQLYASNKNLNIGNVKFPTNKDAD